MNERDHHRQNCLHIMLLLVCLLKKEGKRSHHFIQSYESYLHSLITYLYRCWNIRFTFIYRQEFFTGDECFLRVIRFCTFFYCQNFFRWQEERCGKYRRSRWSWLSLSLFTLSSHFHFVIVFVLIYFYTFEYCTQVTGSGVPRCLAFPTLLHSLTHLSIHTRLALSHMRSAFSSYGWCPLLYCCALIRTPEDLVACEVSSEHFCDKKMRKFAHYPPPDHMVLPETTWDHLDHLGSPRT